MNRYVQEQAILYMMRFGKQSQNENGEARDHHDGAPVAVKRQYFRRPLLKPCLAILRKRRA